MTQGSVFTNNHHSAIVSIERQRGLSHMRRLFSLVLTAATIFIFSIGLVAATTFDVTTTADSGAGSLRDAITLANANPGLDTITFHIPGSGVHTIIPASDLPNITDPVIIDGYTQPGASPNTNPLTLGPGALGSNAVILIELSGSGGAAGAPGLGLNISAGNSTVRGLAINRFARSGINLEPADGNIIEGNFLGTDPTGTVDLLTTTRKRAPSMAPPMALAAASR